MDWSTQKFFNETIQIDQLNDIFLKNNMNFLILINLISCYRSKRIDYENNFCKFAISISLFFLKKLLNNLWKKYFTLEKQNLTSWE